MQTHELQDFKDFLTDALAFWGKDVSQFALSVWWEAMQPYDIGAVKLAFSRHAMNPDSGQFAPKPSDVVRMLGGTTQDLALQAWAKVDKAVRQVGCYESVAFDDALVHRVLHDMGGWLSLSQKTEEEWPFVGREFENRYRGYAMRGETPEYPPVLIGISEAHNARAGHRVSPPRLIGNPRLAEAVLRGGREVNLIGQAWASGNTLRLVDSGAA